MVRMILVSAAGNYLHVLSDSLLPVIPFSPILVDSSVFIYQRNSVKDNRRQLRFWSGLVSYRNEEIRKGKKGVKMFNSP